MQETVVWFLGWEDPLEKGRATHSSILGLPWWFRWQRIRLQCGKPGFDPCVGKLPWRRARQPTPVFLPGESRGQRSLVGYTVHVVAKSRTQLSDSVQHSAKLWTGRAVRSRRFSVTEITAPLPSSTSSPWLWCLIAQQRNIWHPSLGRSTPVVFHIQMTNWI